MAKMNPRNPFVWMKIYDMIRDDLQINAYNDYYAATTLLQILANNKDIIYRSLSMLKGALWKRNVLVVGAGPECVKVSNLANKHDIIIAADGALRCCRDAGLEPGIVVTDLDGVKPKDLMTFDGIIVVHAHGDNIERIVSYVPNLLQAKKKVVGTHQTFMMNPLINVFGGFTDGDRAAFLANYFGALKIQLVGFDFRGIVGKYSKPHLIRNEIAGINKQKKLYWASRLISWLMKEGGSDVECYDCYGIDWL